MSQIEVLKFYHQQFPYWLFIFDLVGFNRWNAQVDVQISFLMRLDLDYTQDQQ